MAKAVIFDLDGTISDTQKFHSAIEARILASFGVVISQEEIVRRFAGVNLKQMFKEMLGDIPHDMESIRAQKYYTLGGMMKQELSAMPGAIELIESLDSEGFPLAVGSASRKFYVEDVLDSLGIHHYFRFLSCGDMVAKGKPEPDIFLLAAQGLGFEPKDCVVIEDGRAGMEAARRAGIPCIGLISDPNIRYPAPFLVSHLADITPEMIKNL